MAEYIEREKLNDTLDELCVNDSLYNALQSIPAADVAPVIHAHWEYIPLKSKYEMVKCSVCGWGHGVVSASDMIFCDHCGAKMDGKDGA